MENIKTKKIKKMNKIYLGFTILLVMLISAGSIYALSYFFVEKKEEIEFDNNLPTFTVDRIEGNNLDKKLLLYYIPILTNKQVHEIKIRHEGKLNLNGYNLEKPLYLKLDTKFDDVIVNKTSIIKAECTSAGIKNEYDDNARPRLQTVNGETKIIIDYTIQQRDKHSIPKSNLISKYELVDKDGKGLSGSTLITTKITQTA